MCLAALFYLFLLCTPTLRPHKLAWLSCRFVFWSAIKMAKVFPNRHPPSPSPKSGVIQLFGTYRALYMFRPPVNPPWIPIIDLHFLNNSDDWAQGYASSVCPASSVFFYCKGLLPPRRCQYDFCPPPKFATPWDVDNPRNVVTPLWWSTIPCTLLCSVHFFDPIFRGMTLFSLA